MSDYKITLRLAGIGASLLLLACSDTNQAVGPTAPNAPAFTAGSGSQSTLLGRGTFAEAFRVKRTVLPTQKHGWPHGRWEVDVQAQPNLDIAVQRIVFQPGGHSGWHSHPGPVFIQVLEGTMTFYESNDPSCAPIVRTAGQGYLDTGDHAHIARNESGAPAVNLVVYLAPPLAGLRIDEQDPGHCPF